MTALDMHVYLRGHAVARNEMAHSYLKIPDASLIFHKSFIVLLPSLDAGSKLIDLVLSESIHAKEKVLLHL